ncbi:ectonucleoside triphosphate diphosphohydrolase 8 isoform X3 [Strigops habroptila]|uniref:ectonucleoside triphosphate diphosphohydrolase 8 isoform X3 n=1 Tax=Strigops habroptila TaxID=2489341 RepID=UPI0011CF1D06|nr:ectonucleoside triphosphate diphosphohydrolase 8 isoform X3 [Strigops habroptila]
MDYKAKVLAGLLAATCVFSFIALILSIVNVKDVILPPSTKYGMVFDAGSTHTTLYIYQWPADKENGTGIVSQVEACTVAGPGISSYADDPAGAGASLKPCLDKAMEIIPAEQQRETPTYLGATAGMRLLREQNSTKAQQVFAEVAKAIGEYPVEFRGAQVLTGNEEGSFSWISVNYLLETLVKYSFAEKWEHPQDAEVLGALDLGGASTQITFQPGVAIEDENTSVFFRLYGTNYSLYTHSYLCYGQTQALKRLLAALHQAFAGFYYTFHFLNLTSQQSLKDVNSTVQAFCKKDWAELVETFPQDKEYLHNYCSTAIYILTLLLDGYKFSEHTWSSIHFRQQAANTDIGWTLGFMLNLTNMIPTEALGHVKGHQPSLWAGAVSCIVLAIVAGLVAGFLQCFCKTK